MSSGQRLGGVPYCGARQTEFYAECRFEQKRRVGPSRNQGAADWITSTHLDHHTQFARDFESTPHGPGNVPLTKPEITRANDLAMLTAMRLLALCCPGAMPQANKTDVDILTKQYVNWWSKAKHIPMGDENDDEDHDFGSDGDCSSSSSSESEDDDVDCNDDAAKGADEKGVGVLDVLAARSEEAKKLSDAAKKDEPTLSALLASVEDLQKEYKAAIAGDKGSTDPSASLFTEILDLTATQRLEQLFPAMVAFLYAAEVPPTPTPHRPRDQANAGSESNS